MYTCGLNIVHIFQCVYIRSTILTRHSVKCKKLSCIKIAIQGRHKAAEQETNIMCNNSFVNCFHKNKQNFNEVQSCSMFVLHNHSNPTKNVLSLRTLLYRAVGYKNQFQRNQDMSSI